MKNKRNILLFLLLIVIIAACSHKNKNTIKTKDVTSIIIGSKIFSVVPITKKEFESGYKKPIIKSEKYLLRASSTVKRHSDTLIFKLKTNNFFFLKDDSTETEADIVRYSYVGEFKDLGYWKVYATYYEWFNEILVNQNTGDTTITIGDPLVSPDKKYILCSNSDLWANETANGIEMFEVVNNKLHNIGFIELEDWGPDLVYWKNSKEIYVKQERKGESPGSLFTYCKLVMN